MECREWIPDFKYEIVRIHDYSNEELLKRGDEMSLVMLINKVQNEADLEEFLHIPAETLNRIVRDSPGHVLGVIASVLESLCFKIDVSEEERTECVRKVRNREMGYLFSNMEHIDVQEMRRKVKKAEDELQKAEDELQKAEDELQKAEDELQKVKEERQRADTKIKKDTIEDIITLLDDLGTVPACLKQEISEQTDFDILRKWYRLAARAGSIEEFAAQIQITTSH